MKMEDIFDNALPFMCIVLGLALAFALVMTVTCAAYDSLTGKPVKTVSECPHCGKEVRLVVP